jgi:hypothetical protein
MESRIKVFGMFIILVTALILSVAIMVVPNTETAEAAAAAAGGAAGAAAGGSKVLLPGTGTFIR